MILKKISQKLPTLSLLKRNFVNSNIFLKNTTTAPKAFSYTVPQRGFFGERKTKEKEAQNEAKEKEKNEDDTKSQKEESIKDKDHKEHKEHKEHHKEHKHKEHKEDEKYKELQELYNDQTHKYEILKKKFEEIRLAYLNNKTETEQIQQRHQKEIDNTKIFAISKFAKDILDVHDNFGRAMDSIEPAEFKNLSEQDKIEAFNTFLEGIEMTRNGLSNVLKKHGVIEYNPLKEEFNPNKHEAVFDYDDEDSESAHGTVGQVLQTGFKIGDRILRPAKVGVIKKKK
jgi:molecular chaperone GrpE